MSLLEARIIGAGQGSTSGSATLLRMLVLRVVDSIDEFSRKSDTLLSLRNVFSSTTPLKLRWLCAGTPTSISSASYKSSRFISSGRFSKRSFWDPFSVLNENIILYLLGEVFYYLIWSIKYCKRRLFLNTYITKINFEPFKWL